MAKLSFKFKDVNMPDWVTYRTISKPITAPAKTSYISPPNMDGGYDFTKRVDGNIYYEDRVIELELQFKGANFSELEERANELGEWLNGRGELVFSHRENEVWQASCYNSIDYKPDVLGHFARLQVMFRCEPFPTIRSD